MNFKDTIFLPETSFQMRGNLAQKEPELLKYWNDIDIYKKLRSVSAGKKKFVLHDGPPFANGNPHAGTAMNKVLKDIVVKLYQMSGYDAPFVPGWDCHGLPIEWKIEEQLKLEGKNKDTVSVVEFRNMCKEFAQYWIEVQKNGFKRLGVIGDWDNPYLTINKISESVIIKQLGKLLVDGSIYRGEKPVYWSVVEQTALADAEIEYMDKKSTSVYVAFKIKNTNIDFLQDAFCVIWTTTPWTLPGNRAISYSKDIEYCLVNVGNKKIVIAKELVENFTNTTGIQCEILQEFSGALLEGVICTHPLDKLGYDFDVRLIDGDHVDIDAGTGLVHTAPGHGIEDFNVCKNYGIAVPRTVNEAGLYYDSVPYFAGKHIFKVDKEMIELLTQADMLLYSTTIVHSYPHSWRSKAPLIFRTTPQWFLSLDATDIRKKALSEIEKTNWIPEQGYNRIKSFITNRGDWCLSRQRVWGIPLPIFIEKKTGEPLRDMDVIDNIANIFEQFGSNAWFERDAQEFLGEKYKADDYIQVMDTTDVWFESSSSHAYVLAERKELAPQADMYLEGSDQHRGWFQHSLLIACGISSSAPFKSVMTHGFIVDEQGRKMSKSLGNTVTLDEIVSKLGADIFRMWVAASDFTQDLKLGMNILKQLEDVYRKLRNTMRYILGSLSGYDNAEDHNIEYTQLCDLEKWVLHRIHQVNKELMECISTYDINKYFITLYTFCSNELSSFFFDIRKDCLYCDHESDTKRRGYRFVMYIIYQYVVRWLAPIAAYMSEEAWLTMHDSSSVHLEAFLKPDDRWYNEQICSKIDKVKELRRYITTALEIARKNKLIGSSLQAFVSIYDPDGQFERDVEFWNEIAIVSGVKIYDSAIPQEAFVHDDAKNIGIIISVADGEKCERCWKISTELNEDKICARCQKVLAH